MKRLDTYCDASPSAEGVAVAWAGWVEAEAKAAPCVEGTNFLSVEAETREAECMAVIECTSALLASIEAGHERQEELVVVHNDNICVAKALASEIVHPPLDLWIPVAREIQTGIESYGTRVQYVWTPRRAPQIRLVHRMAREARTRHRRR